MNSSYLLWTPVSVIAPPPLPQALIQGGGQGCLPPPPPFSESLGIDFYSGFRKKNQVYTFIVASEKKTQGGGVQDFYSGFRKKIQVYTFIVASEKKNTRGGGCNSKS